MPSDPIWISLCETTWMSMEDGPKEESVRACPADSESGGDAPAMRTTDRKPKTERRREQCRRNQRRYRERQHHHAIELDTSVMQLRLEVDRLREQRRLLQQRVLCSDDTVVQTVVEYYRLFRHGLQDHRLGEQPILAQQLAFLHTVIDDNVRVAETYGRAVFLNQLRLWATVHDGFVMHLNGMDVVRGPAHTTAIHQAAHSEITISRRSIRHVFPHLLQVQYQDICRKLLGARLTCPSWGLTICDARGRIVRVAWSIDFVAALQHVLTLEETAIVLGQAQITHDAYLLLR